MLTARGQPIPQLWLRPQAALVRISRGVAAGQAASVSRNAVCGNRRRATGLRTEEISRSTGFLPPEILFIGGQKITAATVHLQQVVCGQNAFESCGLGDVVYH